MSTKWQTVKQYRLMGARFFIQKQFTWFLPHRAPQKSCFCPLRSKTPTVDGPSSGCRPVPPSRWTPGPWPPWTLPPRSRPQARTGPPSPGRKSHSLPLNGERVHAKTISQETFRDKTNAVSQWKMLGMIKMLWFASLVPVERKKNTMCG